MIQATKSVAPAVNTEAQDAIAMLIADHKMVRMLFKQFEVLNHKDGSEKASLVFQICKSLKTHMQIEEELFYPALRQVMDDEDLLDEAQVEHASARDLILQIDEMAAGEPFYDAKVTVLGELIDHHVSEEEKEMFPKARKTTLDLTALGARMLKRKQDMDSKPSKIEPNAAGDKSVLSHLNKPAPGSQNSTTKCK